MLKKTLKVSHEEDANLNQRCGNINKCTVLFLTPLLFGAVYKDQIKTTQVTCVSWAMPRSLGAGSLLTVMPYFRREYSRFAYRPIK